MKHSILSSLLVLLLFSFSPSKADKARDDIYKILKENKSPDTIRLSNIIAYSFSWPRPAFDTMLTLLDEGYATSMRINKPGFANQMLSRKITYYTENGKGMEAFKICQQIASLGEKEKNDAIIANSYYLRGNIFRSYNMLPKAIDEQKMAVEYYGKKKDSVALSEACYLLGWYAFNDKQYELSLKNLNFAFHTIKKFKPKEYAILGEYSGWLGNAFSAVKQFDSALYYRKLGLEYFKKQEDYFGWADSYRYIGNIYRNMKQYDSAMANYKVALSMFGERKMMERFWLVQYFVAETNRALKNYSASAKDLDNLLDTIKGTKDLLSMYLSNQLGTIVYEKTGDYKKAIKCYKNFILFKDSMEKSGQQGAVTELDAKLKFEKEEATLKLEQAQKDAQAALEKERQILIRNIFIVGFCIVGGFLIVVYRNYKEKKKTNKLLEQQKSEIEYQKKEIQDSINYAQNIQSALLPDITHIEKNFEEMFVLYKPKDVVSGDFFWYYKTKDKLLVAAADCTGHGVPGAFMSMIGSYELNNSVSEKGIVDPDKILSNINVSLKQRLKQNVGQNSSKDGMDIALCGFDLKNLKLDYAGANRPLYIIRNNAPLEFAPTKAAIGGFTEDNKEFMNNVIQLQKGDCVYMYTDGYSDQFGGQKNKKLTTKNFKTLLQSIASLNMKEQYKALEKYFYEWKGNFEQLDDVLVIGIKI